MVTKNNHKYLFFNYQLGTRALQLLSTYFSIYSFLSGYSCMTIHHGLHVSGLKPFIPHLCLHSNSISFQSHVFIFGKIMQSSNFKSKSFMNISHFSKSETLVKMAIQCPFSISLATMFKRGFK